MSKTIKYSDDARKEMYEGIKAIAKAVKSTLGPSGKNVLIRNESDKKPFVTKDGVTVAGQFTSDNYLEQIAIELIQDVANNSDAVAGDGTTTATILAEAIFYHGLNAIENNSDINLILFNKYIQEAVGLSIKQLQEISMPCEDVESLKNIALISSNGDEEVSQMVIDAYKISGDQGVVNIRRSETYESYLTTVKGFNLPTGYRSPYYVNDHKNNLVDYENAIVYSTNKKISKISDNLEFLLSYCSEQQIPLLIICKDMDVTVSTVLISNVSKGYISCCVCKAPAFGQEQINELEDLGTVLGNMPFLENGAFDFDDLNPEEIISYLPRVKNLLVTENNVAFSEPLCDEEQQKIIEDKKAIKANELRKELKDKKTSFEKSQLQMRISRLSEGIAYIHIGAKNDLEYTEKQHRIQDCLYAVKSSKEEGILPGGGNALLYVSQLLFETKIDENINQKAAYEVLSKSLQVPFFQILNNAGIEFNLPNEKALSAFKNTYNHGVDARNGNLVNLIDAGIIDPLKVVRSALENASSVIGLLLTTECVIIDNDCFAVREKTIF